LTHELRDRSLCGDGSHCPSRAFRGKAALHPSQAARAALGRVLGWDPVNVVMAHGTIVRGGAPGFIRESFAWL